MYWFLISLAVSAWQVHWLPYIECWSCLPCHYSFGFINGKDHDDLHTVTCLFCFIVIWRIIHRFVSLSCRYTLKTSHLLNIFRFDLKLLHLDCHEKKTLELINWCDPTVGLAYNFQSKIDGTLEEDSPQLLFWFY